MGKGCQDKSHKRRDRWPYWLSAGKNPVSICEDICVLTNKRVGEKTRVVLSHRQWKQGRPKQSHQCPRISHQSWMAATHVWVVMTNCCLQKCYQCLRCIVSRVASSGMANVWRFRGWNLRRTWFEKGIGLPDLTWLEKGIGLPGLTGLCVWGGVELHFGSSSHALCAHVTWWCCWKWHQHVTHSTLTFGEPLW